MRQILLQNPTVLLQNATVVTKCDDLITKCDSYYKMRRLLQIATVHHGCSFLFPKTCGRQAYMSV